jgi:hypothetical protein
LADSFLIALPVSVAAAAGLEPRLEPFSLPPTLV